MTTGHYTVCPTLAKSDPHSTRVFDKLTGNQFQLSAETISLMALFNHQALSIEQALDQIDCQNSQRPVFREFILGLIEQKLLVAINKPQPQLTSPPPPPLMQNGRFSLFNAPQINSFDFDSDHQGSSLLDNIDIGFIGAPFDLGTTGYPGARFAPDRIRQLSANYHDYQCDIFDHKCLGLWSGKQNKSVLKGLAMADFGNTTLLVGEHYDNFYQRVTRATQILLQHQIFPVLVGGDHGVSYASIRALAQHYGPIKLLQIDAHTDLGNIREENANNHGNFVTRLIREGHIDKLYQYGIRQDNCKQANILDPLNHYHKYSTQSLQQLPFTQLTDELKEGNYYLSIDIDVLDPVLAPGTGTTVSDGLSYQQLTGLIATLSSTANIVGFDLMEVNPMRDHNDQTSELAGHLLLDSLSAIFNV